MGTHRLDRSYAADGRLKLKRNAPSGDGYMDAEHCRQGGCLCLATKRPTYLIGSSTAEC